ncbi:hypothetical protein VNO77_24631 [Canavalia gladiata]|uniref:FH2 domain-containing protein n=1 Tax=Canavalia gladiata TaxID=3824 RepID=A0AAN9QCT9_CANGL
MAGESSRRNGADQTRLKPLYWDKIVANVDHSTVWDQINDGSFRFALKKLCDCDEKSIDGKTSLLHFIVDQLVLPLLGTLRDELSEVKKAASIEHQNFITMSTLNDYVTKIRQIITCCGNSERGGFIKVMKGFVEECKEELKGGMDKDHRPCKETNEYLMGMFGNHFRWLKE